MARKQLEFLTAKEVAEIRRKSEAAMAKERQRGEGPRWVKDNGRILYPADEFWAYMENLVAAKSGASVFTPEPSPPVPSSRRRRTA